MKIFKIKSEDGFVIISYLIFSSVYIYAIVIGEFILQAIFCWILSTIVLLIYLYNK